MRPLAMFARALCPRSQGPTHPSLHVIAASGPAKLNSHGASRSGSLPAQYPPLGLRGGGEGTPAAGQGSFPTGFRSRSDDEHATKWQHAKGEEPSSTRQSDEGPTSSTAMLLRSTTDDRAGQNVLSVRCGAVMKASSSATKRAGEGNSATSAAGSEGTNQRHCASLAWMEWNVL